MQENQTENSLIIEECCPDEDEYIEKKSDWDIIDDLIEVYQRQFKEDIPPNSKEKEEIDRAANLLLEKFQPVFKKYITLIKSGQINFKNSEQKQFVAFFIDDAKLRKTLYSRNPVNPKQAQIITYKFGFVKETYGTLDEEEILTDLYVIFFILAKRYKRTNRSFCCYLYNAFKYEMFRHIKNFTKNPANIGYKNISYEEITLEGEKEIGPDYREDIAVESDLSMDEEGELSSMWIAGLSCSELFADLTPLERKILALYYIDKRNDKQIARQFHMHSNTCNMKRNNMVKNLAEKLGIPKDEIKRTRNSGLK